MKKEKALKILKDYIGTGPQAEPVEFDKAIAAAIKEMEKKDYKPYIAKDQEERMMLALETAREKGQFLVKVFLDDQLLHNIFCDRVSVYATKPPTYCLFVGSVNITAFSTRLMVVSPGAKDIIPPETIAQLGRYATIGHIRYENDQLRVESE